MYQPGTTREILEQESEIQPIIIFFYSHIIQGNPIAVSSQPAGYQLCQFRSCSDVILGPLYRASVTDMLLHQQLDQSSRAQLQCWCRTPASHCALSSTSHKAMVPSGTKKWEQTAQSQSPRDCKICLSQITADLWDAHRYTSLKAYWKHRLRKSEVSIWDWWC